MDIHILMVKKLIKILSGVTLFGILFFISILEGCKSKVYIAKGVDAFTYIKLCKNGKYVERNIGMFSKGRENIYGYWQKKNDTIFVKYLYPKIYFSYDSLAKIEEKTVKNAKNICFKVNFPDTLYFGFSLVINKKTYRSNSDTLCVPKQSFNQFDIYGFNTWTNYVIKDSSANFFTVNFAKNYFVPQLKDTIIDPIMKYLIHGRKLIPLNPYTSEPFDSETNYLKRVIIDKYKFYKKVHFCYEKK